MDAAQSEANQRYLQSDNSTARHMRLDVAKILKRFHHVQRSLIGTQAGWIASVPHFDTKLDLARMLWQDSMTADACRERVYELRYPSRVIDVGDDTPLIALCDAAIDAPNALALVRSLAEVFKPALRSGFEAYLAVADDLADGPTIRFLRAALVDNAEQLALLRIHVSELGRLTSDDDEAAAKTWVAALKRNLDALGGIGLEAPSDAVQMEPLPSRRPFSVPDVPARDERFALCRFYWPDTIDPTFPYGEGMLLQLRSAVSHLNEVWAVESGGAILHAFADELGWEFVRDAARWTYDESRHTRMGYERLRRWGFEASEMPMGSFIYDSAAGQGPFVRIGMLHHFETKNIGKKNDRAASFSSYHDAVSQRDMEFDWADETYHAHYGRHWLGALHEKDPVRYSDHKVLGERCEALVATTIESAALADRERSREIALAMIAKAERLAAEGARD